jgi:hypothetical protein
MYEKRMKSNHNLKEIYIYINFYTPPIDIDANILLKATFLFNLCSSLSNYGSNAHGCHGLLRKPDLFNCEHDVRNSLKENGWQHHLLLK